LGEKGIRGGITGESQRGRKGRGGKSRGKGGERIEERERKGRMGDWTRPSSGENRRTIM